MALVYACSMDHYGAAVGTSTNPTTATAQNASWTLPSLAMYGDGWANNAAVEDTGFSGITYFTRGFYSLAAPSWGARGKDYALIANSVAIETDYNSIYYSTEDCYLTGVEAIRLAIPGATQTTRLISFAFSVSALPADSKAKGAICYFCPSSGIPAFTLAVDPSGRLQILEFTGVTRAAPTVRPGTYPTEVAVFSLPTVLSASQAPVITPQTWSYINVQIVTNAAGTSHVVDVWVNSMGAADHVMSAVTVVPAYVPLPFIALGNITMLGFLPASLQGSTDTPDLTQRAIRDIVIMDTTGTQANSLLGQAFVSAQGMRQEDAGGGWSVNPRQGISPGVLDSHTAQTGLRIADAASLEIGASNFTAETRVRFAKLPSSGAGRIATLFAKWRNDTANKSYRFYWDADTASLVWEITTDGSTAVKVKSTPWTPITGHEYHVAVSRAAGVTRVFVNGVELGVAATDANTYFNGNATLGVAALFNDTVLVANTALDGFLDETRLTIGVGRYIADFAPPTAKFGRNATDDPSFASVQLLMGYDVTTVVDESSAVRAVTTTLSGTIPADKGAAYLVLNQRPAWDDTFVEAPNTYAEGTFTFTGLPTAGETITVGAKTYTWASPVGAANTVLVGATTAACITNIIAAINGGAGSGTLYGTGTVTNTAAVALTYLDPQFQLRAAVLGTAGNSVATTTTMAAGAFKAATLTGGLDIPAATDFTIERLPIDVTGVVAAQMTVRASKTDAGSANVRFDLVGPAGGVAAGTALTPDLNPGWMRQMFDTDPDTGAGITPSTLVGGRIRFKRV